MLEEEVEVALLGLEEVEEGRFVNGGLILGSFWRWRHRQWWWQRPHFFFSLSFSVEFDLISDGNEGDLNLLALHRPFDIYKFFCFVFFFKLEEHTRVAVRCLLLVNVTCTVAVSVAVNLLFYFP